MTKNRDTGTEILRILAMLMIVAHHFAVHGGIDYENSLTINNAFVNAMEFGGKIGVNIFVLITGYYSCKSRFSFTRIAKLLFSVEFYSIVLAIVSVAVGAVAFRKKLLITALFPTVFGGGYWFVVIYLILYCISPLLNEGINRISKKTHGFIVVLLLLLYSVLPNTIGQFISLNDFGASTLVWFITIYLLGAYFRKYSFILFRKQNISMILLIASLCVMLIGTTVKWFFLTTEVNVAFVTSFVSKLLGDTGLCSIMSVCISVLLFVVFQGKTFSMPNWMFDVSKSTFGVYLIHDNGNFSKYMWENICGTTSMIYSEFFILYAVVCVVLVFCICSMIEIIRERLVERKVFSLPKIKAFIQKLDNRIKE